MKNKSLPILVLLLFSLITISCDMIEVHPYDTKVKGKKNLNAKNIMRIEGMLKGRESFKFAVISDTQRWYDETEDAVRAINARNDVDFLIHAGDQADFGLTDEFIWMKNILSRLDIPFVSIIGNHDCLGTGKDVFREIYGETNFGFTVGDMRFICMNTNALEYDYSEPVPDFDFMHRELESLPDTICRSVFLMHAAPGSDVFNNNVKKVFEYYTALFPGLQFYIYGHTHALTVDEIVSDGVRYYCYQCPNIKKRTYLLFTVDENGYEYEAVEF